MISSYRFLWFGIYYPNKSLGAWVRPVQIFSIFSGCLYNRKLSDYFLEMSYTFANMEITLEQQMERYIIPTLEAMRAEELKHLEFLKKHMGKGVDFIAECKKRIEFIDLRISQYKEYITRSKP